jgi:adenylate kinase
MTRKVFVHNVGGYLGSHIAKRFADKNSTAPPEEGEEVPERWEVIGTLADSQTKPLWVSRVVEQTPEALEAAFLECEMTVLDCLHEPALAEKQLAAIPASDKITAPKVLIGISSVVTWTRTSVDEEAPETPLTEDEYKRRRPQVNFKDLLALEKLVTKSKRDDVLRTHVVAAGVPYGAEEDIFHPLFKAAWHCKPLPLLSLEDGSNLLPTVHIADLCSVVERLLEQDSKPYLLAVDAGQQQEQPQTLLAITTKLSAELGTGELTRPVQADVFITQDYEFFQAGIRLAPAAVDELGFEWHMKEGLLANLSAVVKEYRDARKINALRLVVHGNDDLAMHALAQAVAAEYKVPHVHAATAVAKAAAGTDELAAEIHAAGATVSDILTAKVLRRELTSAGCLNQGYVLEGFPQNLEQAKLIFRSPPEGEEAEAAAEEGEAPKETAAPAAPEYVVVLEATDDEIKRKQLALPDTKVTEAEMAARLATYRQHNQEDSPTALLALPALASVEALTLSSGGEASADDLLGKVRIYLGQHRNYGPSQEELDAVRELAEQEAAAVAAAEEAKRKGQEAEERAEAERRKALEARRMAELQMQERELLEVRSQPLRNYLMANVIPTLTEGLIEVCKVKPDDPIDHLAEWLLRNSPVDDDHFE